MAVFVRRCDRRAVVVDGSRAVERGRARKAVSSDIRPTASRARRPPPPRPAAGRTQRGRAAASPGCGRRGRCRCRTRAGREGLRGSAGAGSGRGGIEAASCGASRYSKTSRTSPSPGSWYPRTCLYFAGVITDAGGWLTPWRGLALLLALLALPLGLAARVLDLCHSKGASFEHPSLPRQARRATLASPRCQRRFPHCLYPRSVGGIEYVIIAISFGLATGIIGRGKGSSFFIWFCVGAVLPFLGLAAVILFRSEQRRARAACPTCHKVLKLYVQVCPRCGTDLEFPRRTNRFATPWGRRMTMHVQAARPRVQPHG